MIKVIVCDDQEIVCQGLRTILNNDPQIEVVATAHDGIELIPFVEKLQPDLILMDLKMPVMNGVQATQHIHQSFPHIKILILTTYDDEEWLFDAIRSGASGYLLKDTPASSLIQAIKGTVSGETYLDPAVAGKVLSSISEPRQSPLKKSSIQLSDREMEVLQLMARGLVNADIARELYLSEGTVRNYTSAIFTKLGVNDRTQAVIAALRHGLVNLDI
ncbi:MAG: response regulator transcription factor [Anaerolineaceae bacterium]|nr:MAG: DNA-binding response regulator [Chloroflexi bacterium HGW-Chloroflexi-8]